MLEKFGGLIIPAILLLVGLAGIETAWADASYPLFNRIAMTACMSPFLILGGMLAWAWLDELKKRNSAESEINYNLKEVFLPGYAEPKDSDPQEKFLTAFRRGYKRFFLKDAAVKNSDVQNTASQVFLGILQMQKDRLKRLGVEFEFEAKRKKYLDDPVRADRYFDGRYEVSSIDEDIAARSTFYKDGKKIYTRMDSQTAHYTVLHAHRSGSHKIICPNCGAETTRQNLLDGCDYCGTKFVVEDLEDSVADFSLRTNYEVQKAKYADARRLFMLWGAVGIVLLCFLFCLYWTLKVTPGIVKEEQIGPFMTVLASLFTVLVPTALFSAILIPGFTMLVWPVLALSAAFVDVSRRTFNRMAEAMRKDIQNEKLVRKHDRLFSLADFYAGVQSRISTIVYAENETQANVFAKDRLNIPADRYKNAVSLVVDDMDLTGYEIKDGRQIARVMADLRLTILQGNRCRIKHEKVKLVLSRGEDSRTQAVCAPYIMKCRGCGTSLSLTEGKVCPSCGREADFTEDVWLIDQYKVN